MTAVTFLEGDSQVCLAALCKGRSSSKRLNQLLRGSLATVLGSGIYGNYGFVPSLANVSDDPTRGKRIRPPCRDLPDWWKAALVGDFSCLDEWLQSIGFHLSQVAQLPRSLSQPSNFEDLKKEVLDPLRNVQKPEKLAAFDTKHGMHVVQKFSRPKAPRNLFHFWD